MNFRNFIIKLQGLSENQKKIILWTVVVILGLTMGYFWIRGAMNNLQKLGENINQIKLPEIQTPATETLNEQTADWKIYQLSLCGVTLTVKNEQLVKINTGISEGLTRGQLIVGDPMPNSDLEISCREKNKNPQSNMDKLMNDVSSVLDIQSDGSNHVNKNNYPVFDKQTISSITQLYSAKNRGYRNDSETVGFENQNWMYIFSFLNPEQSKNQNSFIISVYP